MLQVTVALPSGCSEKFSIPQSSKVGDLKVLAQKSFQRGFLRLVAADHRALDPTVSLQAAGLEDGDHLTAIVLEAKLAATEAFALLLPLFCSGGDRVVTQRGSFKPDFAAILADGSRCLGRWWWQLWSPRTAQRCPAGSSNTGLHLLRSWLMGQSWLGAIQTMVVTALKSKISSRVSSSFKQRRLQLRSCICCDPGWWVQQFKQLSFVTWGSRDQTSGGDSSEVQDQLKGVQQVQATSWCICCDPGWWVSRDLGQSRLWWWQLWSPRSAEGCPAGSSNSWGICCDPGRWVSRDLGRTRLWWWQLWSPRSAEGCPAASSNVQCICCDPGWWVSRDLGRIQTMLAVTALKSKISWRVSSRFKQQAMHLLRSWLMGQSWLGAIQTLVVTALKSKISSKVSSRFKQRGRAFAAILADGSVVTWGSPDHGGNSCPVQAQLKGVQQLQATKYAFAAILADGSVATWGKRYFGGNCSEVQYQLKGVQQVQSYCAMHLLRSWLMGQLWLGANQTMVVTVRQFRPSFHFCDYVGAKSPFNAES